MSDIIPEEATYLGICLLLCALCFGGGFCSGCLFERTTVEIVEVGR